MWTYIILIIYSKLDLKTCLKDLVKNVTIIVMASLFQFATVLHLTIGVCSGALSVCSDLPLCISIMGIHVTFSQFLRFGIESISVIS